MTFKGDIMDDDKWLYGVTNAELYPDLGIIEEKISEFKNELLNNFSMRVYCEQFIPFRDRVLKMWLESEDDETQLWYIQGLQSEIYDIQQTIFYRGYLHKYTYEEVSSIINNSYILPLAIANNKHPKIRMGGDNRYYFLCQLHDEQTPSMGVYDINNRFKCYGCMKGGNIIAYLMAFHRLNFKEALDLLCEIYLLEVKGINGKYKELANYYQKAILSSQYKELLEEGKERLLNRTPIIIETSDRSIIPVESRSATIEELYRQRFDMIERIREGEHIKPKTQYSYKRICTDFGN